jgi:hypothetical protein
MAAPAHYIRTIHTSFTAAHPHSSTAWANAAAVRSPHHTFTASINSHNSQLYQQHLQQQHNFQHHHPHQQQLHHLQARKSNTTSLTGGSVAPSPAGAGGRRRAASIRMAPSSTPSSSYVKFDPFADEPLSAYSSPLVPSSQVNRISYTTPNSTYNNRDYHQQRPSIPSGSDSASALPLTIHIPAAAPTEIKRYSTSSSPNRRITNFTSNSTSPSRSTSPSGSSGSTFLGGSTIPTLNPSKIVAGILLNRVHAVGKPMRRRIPVLSGPKQYVKSGLSSVVSVEV